MKKPLAQIFALSVALAAVGAVALAARAAADAPDEVLKEIAGYKSWTRVTETPIVVESSWAGG